MIDRKKRKKFGQNYLIDPVTIHKIIKSIGLDHQLPYLEIGPGHGAITDSFIGAINNYSAVEIDHENIEFLLKKYGDQQINLISQDILSFNFESLPENTMDEEAIDIAVDMQARQEGGAIDLVEIAGRPIGASMSTDMDEELVDR